MCLVKKLTELHFLLFFYCSQDFDGKNLCKQNNYKITINFNLNDQLYFNNQKVQVYYF